MIKPFFFYAQKILPLVYDDSLSYYEVLAKLTTKVNEVITEVNNLGDTHTIPNVFATHEDMVKCEELKAGMFAFTEGYYSGGDRGACTYVIISEEEQFASRLNNGLYALPVEPLTVTPEMFGAYGDFASSTNVGHDDTDALNNAIAYAGKIGAKVLLNAKYYSATGVIVGGVSGSGLTIEATGGNTNFNGIYSGAAKIVTQRARNVKWDCVTISSINFVSTFTNQSIGISIETSVDDHMAYFYNCQFRYLQKAIVIPGNSVEAYDCHFSLCRYGIYVENGSSIYSPYVFKSLVVNNCRFHDTLHCFYVDKTIQPESNGNGIRITNCFADKCGEIYRGTCYNLSMTNNYFTTTRRDTTVDPSAYLDGMVVLEGWINADDPSLPPSVSAGALCSSNIEGNTFKCGQNFNAGGGIIVIKNSRRLICINANMITGSGAKLVSAVDAQYTNVLDNSVANHGISFDSDSANITIAGNVAYAGTAPAIDVPVSARIGDNFGFAE